jgi:hypothetical protein
VCREGVELQSAKPHWLLGIRTRGSVWWTRIVSVDPKLLVLTASYAGGAVTSTVLAAALRMYSARTRPVIVLPSRLCAMGRWIFTPLVMSPSHPAHAMV